MGINVFLSSFLFSSKICNCHILIYGLFSFTDLKECAFQVPAWDGTRGPFIIHHVDLSQCRDASRATSSVPQIARAHFLRRSDLSAATRRSTTLARCNLWHPGNKLVFCSVNSNSICFVHHTTVHVFLLEYHIKLFYRHFYWYEDLTHRTILCDLLHLNFHQTVVIALLIEQQIE